MLGRRQSWPALVLLGVGLLTLALTLKGQRGDLPVEPEWLLGAAVGAYVLLGVALGGASWRWPAAALVMTAGHAFLALLMGCGYGALEGVSRSLYDVAVHGLWDYLPGTALQVGFAVALGVTAVAWWTREVCPECFVVPPEGEPEVICLPELDPLAPPAAALARIAAVNEVGAALVAEGARLLGAGAWERDPAAALDRLRHLARLTGAGLNTYDLGPTRLVVRSEEDRCAAVLTTSKLPTAMAHELLRGVWALDVTAAAPAPAAAPPEPATTEPPTLP